MTTHNNIHANLIAIDGKGVLISGASGSGKTLLALHLYRRCHHAKVDAHLISDDQVLLHERDGELIGSAPASIRGKVEVRGFGVVDIPIGDVDEAKIILHVALTSQSDMSRLWDGETVDRVGMKIDSLTLATDNIEAAGNAVLAKLGCPIWV